MMLKVVVILIFLSVMVASGKELACPFCSSNISWSECGKTESYAFRCRGPSIQCYSVFYTEIDKVTKKKTQEFFKSCKSDCTKSAIPQCRSDASYERSCDLKCCSTDNCNRKRIIVPSTVPSASHSFSSLTGLVIAGTITAYLSKMK